MVLNNNKYKNYKSINSEDIDEDGEDVFAEVEGQSQQVESVASVAGNLDELKEGEYHIDSTRSAVFLDRTKAFPKKYQFLNKQVKLSLLLSNNKNIRRLNKNFRSKNKNSKKVCYTKI